MIPPDRRWQLAGLAVLGVLTAILVIWSLPLVRNPVPAAPAQVTSHSPVTPTLPTPTPSPASPTASPSPSSPAKKARTGLSGLAELLASKEKASVVVLGDGSGDAPQEWVGVWTKEHVAKNRQVSYRSWNSSNQRWGGKSVAGSGAPATIWNASKSAPTLADEPKRVATIWKSADAVILSYGHRKTPHDIGGQLEAIFRAIRKQSPDANVVVMLQNPDPVAFEATQPETVQAVKRWAEKNKLDTVNIYDAFVANPAPRYELVEKDGSPTPTGSALWAKTFNDAIASA